MNLLSGTKKDCDSGNVSLVPFQRNSDTNYDQTFSFWLRLLPRRVQSQAAKVCEAVHWPQATSPISVQFDLRSSHGKKLDLVLSAISWLAG